MYKEVIDDYLRKGIAEEGLNNPEQILFYFPHQDVLKENNITTKLRAVFDASAHSVDAQSLFVSWTKSQSRIIRNMANFRLHQIAFTADIEQAFLQIMPDQRDAVRLNEESETNYKT
ncbi:hypothetical protein AVEN_218706-1 [Araneus ventricosus]|uniref:Reverse transcriptase domain-containing protein n=1 Tax=Araneus ventricosus TaxID=182803 RepID=A0A4Y2B7E3_ARAVE|nr:hypothetical protein AVEN_218706-1 [Araneus ventricosus]